MKLFKKLCATLALTFCMLLPFCLSACDFSPKPEEPSNVYDTTAADGVIEALTKQRIEALTVEGTYFVESKIDGASSYKMDFEAKGSLNINDGDGDFFLKSAARNGVDSNMKRVEMYGYVREWIPFFASQAVDASVGTLPASALGYIQPLYEDGQNYTALGLLDMYVKYYLQYTSINVEFLGDNYKKYARHAIELLGYDVAKSQAPDIAMSALNFVNGVILSAADVAEAVKRDGDKITIDLVKMLNTVVADMESVANSLNENTTIKDFLLNETVKKYAESLTRTLTVEKVQNKLLAIVNDYKNDTQELGGFIPTSTLDRVSKIIGTQPNVGSTGYEYLVKIATSADFTLLMREDFGISGFPSENANLFALLQIDKERVMNAVAKYKEQFNQYAFKDNGVTVTQGENTGSAHYNIEYTIGVNNELKSLAVNYETEQNSKYDDKNYSSKGAISEKIAFLNERVSLEDVSAYRVVSDVTSKFADEAEHFGGREWDGCNNCDGYYCDYGYDYVATPVFENNEIISFNVTVDGSSGGAEIASSYDKNSGTLIIDGNGDGVLDATTDDVWQVLIEKGYYMEWSAMAYRGEWDLIFTGTGDVEGHCWGRYVRADETEYDYITIAEYLESKNQSAE